MAKFQDSDLFLVNRNSKSYKVTGAEVKEYYQKPPTINSVVLTEKEDLGVDRFNAQSFITTADIDPGIPEAENNQIRAIVNAEVLDRLETSAITNVGTDSGAWVEAQGPSNQNYTAITYGEGKFVAIGRGGVIEYSTDGINWSEATTTTLTSNNWVGIAYGNGRFVALSSDGAVRAMYSEDGITWNQSNAITAADYADITFGEGKFIAVGTNMVSISTDGKNWGQGTGEVGSRTYNAVAYGDGVFVGVMRSNTQSATWSADGYTWQNARSTRQGVYNSVAYGNGVFIAVGRGTNHIMISKDKGQTWTGILNIGDIASKTWTSITFAAGKFVAVCDLYASPQTMYSYDGDTWYPVDSAATKDWVDLTYGNGKFVALAQNAARQKYMYSTTGGPDEDQLTFADNKDLDIFKSYDEVYQSDGAAEGTIISTNPSGNTLNLYQSTGTWANGQTVIGEPRPLTTSEIVGTSDIGGVWNRVQGKPVTDGNWRDVTYGDGQFVAVTPGTNIIMRSPDGETWTSETIPNAANWYGIAYGDGKYVAVARGGGPNNVMYSTDGQSWDEVSAQPQGNSIIYGGGNFVTVNYGSGSSSNVQYSEDGINWTRVSPNPASDLRDVAYGNGVYVSAGNPWGGKGNIAYSTDLDNWTLLPQIGGGQGLHSIAFGDGKFVAIPWNENSPSAYISYDGIDWLEAPLPNRPFRTNKIRYGGGKFVIVGNTASYLYSYDGFDWKWASMGFGAVDFYGLAYGNDRFVAVANLNAAWSLTGGADESTLTFADDKNLDRFEISDSIRQNDNAATSSVTAVNPVAKTMQVGNTSGSWSANTDNYVIGPDRSSTYTEQLYCKLNSNLDVIDLVKTNPGYTNYTGDTATIKFPYYLPNGEPADDTLLDGSSIYTQVKVNNLAFPAVTKKSNTVTPASTCIAGPIETGPITNVSTLNGDWNPAENPGGSSTTTWKSVAYGNGKFVAVGNSNLKAMYSEDGINWSPASGSVLSIGTWESVTYGDGKFVAVNSTTSNKGMYSLDGITWEQMIMPSSQVYMGVTYGSDLFVAVAKAGSNGDIAYSSNGINWTNHIMQSAYQNLDWRGIAHKDGRFVIAGQSGSNRMMWADANQITNWRAASGGPTATGSFSAITAGPDKFVAVGNAGAVNGNIAYSDDGERWYAEASSNQPPDNRYTGVAYGNGVYVAVADGNPSSQNNNWVIYSYDGKTWILGNPTYQSKWSGITYGGGKFVAVAMSGNNNEQIMWSYTGGPENKQLSFDIPKGLDELSPGDSVDQSNSAASGFVAYPNVDANTIRVYNSTGTWAAGQTVLGPNRVCPPITFDASDPADIAQFEAIKASFEGYETSKKLHRAGLISRMLVAGFTEQQISAFDLDVADVALSINGYYPLYTTEVLADAAGNGASHAHVIDGVTYYMPDGGVPIYHGSYNEPEDTTSDSTDSSSTDTTDSGSTDSTDSDSTDTTDSDDSGSTDSGSSSSGGSYGY